MTPKDSEKENIISEGVHVLIVLNERKRWLVKALSGQKFHCHKGFFNYEEIIGKPFGIKVQTNTSTPLSVYKPLPSDFLKHMPHSSQIIYTKDAGLILLYGGIGPGSQVLEAGTGSGALTSILANYVRPNGHVYSYENREEAFKTAKKNIQRLDLDEYVTLKLQDATEGFEEKNVDAVVLDLGNPEELIPIVYDSLRSSGTISIFVPTFNQIEKVYAKLRELKFGDIHAMELIQRKIQLKLNAIRPNTRMIGHTGFLIFARKIIK